jgi:hypothetical protein
LDTTFAGGVTVGGRQLAPNVCIRISTTNTGPLNAWVADSRGELNALDDGTSGIGSTAGSIGSTLTNGQNLNACYTGFRTLYVNGADPNDGWIGSLEVSLDGGTSWTYLVCAAGCIRGHSGQEVLVHYEFTSTSGTTTVAKVCAPISAGIPSPCPGRVRRVHVRRRRLHRARPRRVMWQCINMGICSFILP